MPILIFRTVTNAKISVPAICVEALIYLLLYDLHDCSFNIVRKLRRFFGAKKFLFLKYKIFFFRGGLFFIFSTLGLKVAQVAAYITTNRLFHGTVV